LPGRAEFGTAVPNLAGEAERAGVRIVAGTRVDRALVETERPDVVIVATGARPRRPALELRDEPVVLDAWQVISGESVPPGHVVVADWRCDWTGMGVALLLAEQGHRVTLAVDGYMPGLRVQQYVRDVMQAAMHRARVRVLPTTRVYGADADSVYLQHTLSGEPVIVEDVAALVLALGHEPEDGLLHGLEGYAGEVRAIGDCLAPRTVEEAVLEGLVAATEV
jgi:pyruvate/2-oxoglutarate dehydrogenase complex dihydrolipoamide dehydrogenase (E3) component